MKQVCFLVILFYHSISFCQPKTDTLHFFYEVDQVMPKDLQPLEKLQGANGANQIEITGFADFLHSSSYNQALSQERADRLRSIITERYPALSSKITSCTGKGEQFSKGNSPTGEQWWRRVDVVITGSIDAKSTQKPSGNKPPEKTRPVKQNEPAKKLEDLKHGESITLEGLSFIPGRHVILPKSLPKLEELLSKLQENPGLKIEIQGHVCCTENGEDGFDHDTKDYKLSVNRAKAIYQYLVKNGIDKDRLRYRGFGGSRPKVPETSEENEQVNRRVEIMVLSGAGKEEAQE